MLKSVAALALLVFAGLATCENLSNQTSNDAETVTIYEGVPTIRDGDNVKIDGENIRPSGIDACGLGQPARLAGREIDCGIWARDHFRDMIGPRTVRCESTERDFYDRPLATCYTGDRNLNRALVENGYAFPYWTSEYKAEADTARETQRGVWLFERSKSPLSTESGNGSRCPKPTGFGRPSGPMTKTPLLGFRTRRGPARLPGDLFEQKSRSCPAPLPMPVV